MGVLGGTTGSATPVEEKKYGTKAAVLVSNPIVIYVQQSIILENLCHTLSLPFYSSPL